MVQIEYCDNTNCLLNNNHKCGAQEVDIDENATCITACYDEGDPFAKDIVSTSEEDSEVKYA